MKRSYQVKSQPETSTSFPNSEMLQLILHVPGHEIVDRHVHRKKPPIQVRCNCKTLGSGCRVQDIASPCSHHLPSTYEPRSDSGVWRPGLQAFSGLTAKDLHTRPRCVFERGGAGFRVSEPVGLGFPWLFSSWLNRDYHHPWLRSSSNINGQFRLNPTLALKNLPS